MLFDSAVSQLYVLGVPDDTRTERVKEERAPGITLAGFSRGFSWWHFNPTKMIAGDVHLRCQLYRRIGFFLLRVLVPSDLNGSSWKT